MQATEQTVKHARGRLDVEGPGKHDMFTLRDEPGNLAVAKVLDVFGLGAANAARLAACWNACLDLPDPERQVREMREAIHSAIQTIEQLIPEESARGVANVVLFQLRASINP